jgi:biotin carboxyl carrier protein
LTFQVEAGGTRRTINVQRAGDGWTITVDGRAMSASVSRIEGRWSLLYGDRDEKGPRRSYEIVLEPRQRSRQLIHVDGRDVTVWFLDEARGSRGTAATGPGVKEIVAPMPGRVVKVLVKAGDSVAAHQGLVVVEAMKMENELRAPRSGTVASVRVTEGMSVEANAVLVVVE